MSQATNDNSTSPTHLRGRMEKAIEQLLAALDALEAANEDLEDTDVDGPGEDEEPSLAAPEVIGPSPQLPAQYSATNYWPLNARQRNQSYDQEQWAKGPPHYWDSDLEEEHDGREDGHDAEQEINDEPQGDTDERGGFAISDHEPCLGSFDRMFNQTKSWTQVLGPSNWWAGQDTELDNSDREPSLGAPEITWAGSCVLLCSQQPWAKGGKGDREFDPAEHGEAEQGI